MTKASKEDFWRFSEKFEYFRKPALSCIHNGIRACIRVIEIADEVPRIYHVSLPELDDEHVYVYYENKVYNAGMTAGTDEYPDLEFSQLSQIGTDITTFLLHEAKESFLKEVDDAKKFKALGYLIISEFQNYGSIAAQISEDDYYLYLLDRGISLSLSNPE